MLLWGKGITCKDDRMIVGNKYWKAKGINCRAVNKIGTEWVLPLGFRHKHFLLYVEDLKEVHTRNDNHEISLDNV